MLQEVAAHAHGGLILFMTDALQDYLQMEATLKKLPEHMRLSEEEKYRFDGIKGVRKEFIKNYLKAAVDEVIEAHRDDTDTESDEDTEILKSIWL
jgi:hypothetical protein